MQVRVDFFERSEKAAERIPKLRGPAPGLPEIALPELIAARDHRRSHGSVFMRSLRPGKSVFLVNPDREAHERYSPQAPNNRLRKTSSPR